MARPAPAWGMLAAPGLPTPETHDMLQREARKSPYVRSIVQTFLTEPC